MSVEAPSIPSQEEAKSQQNEEKKKSLKELLGEETKEYSDEELNQMSREQMEDLKAKVEAHEGQFFEEKEEEEAEGDPVEASSRTAEQEESRRRFRKLAETFNDAVDSIERGEDKKGLEDKENVSTALSIAFRSYVGATDKALQTGKPEDRTLESIAKATLIDFLDKQEEAKPESIVLRTALRTLQRAESQLKEENPDAEPEKLAELRSADPVILEAEDLVRKAVLNISETI